MRSRRRLAAGWMFAGLLAFASAARADTLLFLASEPGEPIGGGELHVFTPDDGTFTAGGTPNQVEVTFSSAGATWYLTFQAAGNASLAPGLFTVVPPSGGLFGPSLDVRPLGSGCTTNGQFTIREIGFDPLGHLASLAVDFEQRCAYVTKSLVGALRFRSGDATCAGAAEGAPCDDLDACTTGDACQAGTCAGTDAVSPACTAAGQCLDAGRCNPATGACVGGAQADGMPCDDGNPATPDDTCTKGLCAPCPPRNQCQLAGVYYAYQEACGDVMKPDDTPCDDGRTDTVGDRCGYGVCVGCPPAHQCERAYVSGSTCGAFLDFGAPCDDGNACTTGDLCSTGGCTGGTAVDCNDDNPCTLDRCDPATGCEHDVVPGCWVIVARTVLTARASGEVGGRSVECTPLHCQQTGQGVLLLPGDGTYRIPTSQPDCPRQPTRIPDEVGPARRMRDGRLFLRPSNRADIRRALRQCSGRRVAFGGSQWVKLSADGRALTGIARTQATIFAQLPIEETLVSYLTGRLGAVPPPAVLKPGLRTCPTTPQLRCVVH
jgi:hypothetical protein